MAGGYHGMDYRKKSADHDGWAAPIVTKEDWESRFASQQPPVGDAYRPQPPATVYVEDEPRAPVRQRVAVGRGHEVQYNPQAREMAARLHAQRVAEQQAQAQAVYEEPAYTPPPEPVYEEVPQPAPAEPLPEDDPIAAWEAQRAQESEQSGRKKPDRRGMLEKSMSRVVLGVLTGCFVLGTALMVVLPRSTVSKIEKRELAQLPEFSFASYFSGEFTAGVANFYDDTVPMRDELKNMGNNFKAVFGLPKSEESVEFVGTVNKVGGDQVPVPITQPESEPSASEPEGESSSSSQAMDPVQMGENVNGGMALLAGAAGRHMDGAAANGNKFVEQEAEGNITENGLIVIKQDGHFRALELFGGGLGESYASALNDLYSQVGDHVQIWSMPAPLACEFYLPSNFQEYSVSQSDAFDKTHELLNQGIHAINMCPALSKHVDEPIYCRTDHHWQPLGAYYAAQVFAEAAGVPFDDLSTYTQGSIPDFVGTMYSFTGSADILNDPEDFVYYEPGSSYTSAYYDTSFNLIWDEDNWFAEGASGSDAYIYYLGGDGYIVKTDTQVNNGRKLLLIKDSYGNAMAPFFTGSFEQIYVADVRYLERNLVSFINDMGITDTLFTMSSYSFVGNQGANIGNLLSQNAGETVTDGQIS